MEFEYLKNFGDDITFCVADCKTDCRRKPAHIINKYKPHSFTNFSEVCKSYRPSDEHHIKGVIRHVDND